MKVSLYILLSLAAIFVVVFVGMFFYIGYRVLTGKMTYKDLEKIEKQEKERKAKKRKTSGSAHWISYPSPLNHWGLWH